MLSRETYAQWCDSKAAELEVEAMSYRGIAMVLRGEDVTEKPNDIYEEINCMLREQALDELANEAQILGLYDVPAITSTCGDVQLEFDFMKENGDQASDQASSS
jgi:hypothetical protein